MTTWGFVRGSEEMAIKLVGRSLMFSAQQGHLIKYAPIEGLKLNPSTIVEEFPYLAGKPIADIRSEAIKRFKAHIISLKSDMEVGLYLIDDLGKHGWKIVLRQKPGHRAEAGIRLQKAIELEREMLKDKEKRNGV